MPNACVKKRSIELTRGLLHRLRKERGWTQQQVADQIGLSVGQVKKYEKGDSAPTLHILGRIAMVYGVSTDELVFEDGKGVAGVKLEPALLQRFEKVAQLPKEEKDAILLLIDSVVAKHTIREVMGT